MAIDGLGSGAGAISRPGPARVASDVVARVDPRTQAQADRAENDAAIILLPASDKDDYLDQLDSGKTKGGGGRQELADGARQLADRLDAQFDSARMSRAESGSKPVSSSEIFERLDKANKGYLDREALQAAFAEASTAEKSTDTQANAAKVEQIFNTLDVDGNNQITPSEFATGIEQITAQGAASKSGDVTATGQAAGAPPLPRAGALAESSTTAQYDPADSNEDGTVSLQELVAYQTSAAKTESAEATAETKQDMVRRISVQLAETYGRFDQDIANATSSINVLSTMA